MRPASTSARCNQLSKQWYLVCGTSRSSPPPRGSAPAGVPTSHKASSTRDVCLSVRQQRVLHLHHIACKNTASSRTHTTKLSSREWGRCVEYAEERLWLEGNWGLRERKKKILLLISLPGSILGLTYFESASLWISTSHEVWTGSQKRGRKATEASSYDHSGSLYKSGASINVVKWQQLLEDRIGEDGPKASKEILSLVHSTGSWKTSRD